MIKIEKDIITRIQSSIDYIENNLFKQIEIERIAEAAFMSKSLFYIVFSKVVGITVKDYIRKRRLSLSAYELINSNTNILEIALNYGYTTPESYSRAFKKLFGISPKNYRKLKEYYNLFPRLTLSSNLNGGAYDMNETTINKKIELIKNGYILDIDIDKFASINKNYSIKAGDMVLIEVPKRINEVLKNNKINTEVIRISADEFIVILKDVSQSNVEKLSDKMIASMKNAFKYNNTEFNVSISIGISKFSINNNDMIIQNARNAMIQAKKNGRNQYKILN